MNGDEHSVHINARDLLRLHGATVLVEARHDHANPPVSLRGTVEARPDAAGRPDVKIVVEYPDMFSHPATRGVIALNEPEARELLASNRGGVLHYLVDEIQDPGIEPPGAQASS